MKNSECIRKWVNHIYDYYKTNCLGSIQNIKFNTKHVHGIENKLYSYNTPICIFSNGVFFVSRKKYSRTTTQHQCYLKNSLSTISFYDTVLIEYVEDVNKLDIENNYDGNSKVTIIRTKTEDKIRLCVSDEYSQKITDKILGYVVDDLSECADSEWSDGDLKLAIGRALVHCMDLEN